MMIRNWLSRSLILHACLCTCSNIISPEALHRVPSFTLPFSKLRQAQQQQAARLDLHPLGCSSLEGPVCLQTSQVLDLQSASEGVTEGQEADAHPAVQLKLLLIQPDAEGVNLHALLEDWQDGTSQADTMLAQMMGEPPPEPQPGAKLTQEELDELAGPGGGEVLFEGSSSSIGDTDRLFAMIAERLGISSEGEESESLRRSLVQLMGQAEARAGGLLPAQTTADAADDDGDYLDPDDDFMGEGSSAEPLASAPQAEAAAQERRKHLHAYA